MNRIAIYGKLGELDDALSDYNALLKLDPGKVSMRIGNFAEYHSKSSNAGDGDNEASEYAASIARIADALASAFARRCRRQLHADPASMDALHACDTSLSLSKKNGFVLEMRGFIHLRRKEFADARADFDAALKINPKSAIALYLRGTTEHDMGDDLDATEDIASAKIVDPHIVEKFHPSAKD